MISMIRMSMMGLVLGLSYPAWAGTCQTWFVDDDFSLRNAIDSVNINGCTSGGLNEIVIDYVKVSESPIASPLPIIQRPVHIRPAAGAPARHVIRVTDNSSTTSTAALIANARVVIEGLDIQGGADRDFAAGILLQEGADNSRLIGNRISRMRILGISITDVNNVTVESSASWPTVLVDNGWGTSASPRWGAGLVIRSSLDVTVTGALLGVDEDGTLDGNCSYGIDIDDSTLVQIGQNATDPDGRNVIGGNRFGGIRITETNAVSILGNYVGLGANGLDPIGNGNEGSCFPGTPPLLQRGGIVVVDSGFVGIGATTANQASFITDNVHGIVLSNAQSTTVIRNNLGRRPNGSILANRNDAIQVIGASGNSGAILIGSDNPQFANRIVGDSTSRYGIDVGVGVGEVRIRTNTIYGHGDQAIDRTAPPVPPQLISANALTGVIDGTLQPSTSEGVVDLFADLAGESQARYYLGSVSVPALADAFAATVPSINFVEGRPITATFTTIGPGGSGTSRLANPILAQSVDSIFSDRFQ